MNEPADPRYPHRRSIDIDIEYLRNLIQGRGNIMRLRYDPTYPFSGRWMGSDPNRMGSSPGTNLRVSDAERNEVADKLSRHFSEGRLDQAEFKERLDAAMSAKTQSDLAGLFGDLPPLASDPPPPPPRRHRVVPFLLIVAFLALAVGSSISIGMGHAFQVPWLLIAVIGFFIWRRAGRQHHHHSHYEHGS
jgi:hypothetical protein